MDIKLDKIDKKIIYELDRNARIPETTLAKIVGRSKESIRYRIKQLKLKGIIQGFSIWIDPTKLGYHSYKLYLKIASIPEKQEQFIDFIKKEKQLFWLGIADGSWHIGLTFFAKNNLEFYRLENELLSKFHTIVLRKYTAVLVNVIVLSKDFLLTKNTRSELILFSDTEQNKIDDLDKQLLELLFQDSRMTIVDLANKIGFSGDIIRNRIKKLEDKNIIVQYKTKINFNRLGYNFFKTFLFFNNLSEKNETILIEYLKQFPAIIHIVRQISPWEMELEIMVKSYSEYNQIINNLRKEFSHCIMNIESAIMNQDHVFPAGKLIF